MKKLNLQANIAKSILSIVILLLIGCDTRDDIKNDQDQIMNNKQFGSQGSDRKAARVDSIAIERCRKQLHRATDQDDLIQQMYYTALRDNCLYAMDLEELQKIWDIPVLKGGDAYPSSSRLGIWVNKTDNFTIYPISTNFYTKYEQSIKPKSMFIDNNFPSFLPRPIVIDKTEERLNSEPLTDGVILDYDYKSSEFAQPGFIQAGFRYIWKRGFREMEAINLYGSIIRIEFNSSE